MHGTPTTMFHDFERVVGMQRVGVAWLDVCGSVSVWGADRRLACCPSATPGDTCTENHTTIAHLPIKLRVGCVLPLAGPLRLLAISPMRASFCSEVCHTETTKVAVC
jgi:hypothetical protein